MKSARFAVVIPARLESRRFPGKPLATVLGRPLIEWVYVRASRIEGAPRVIVATDSPEIVRTVEGFGGLAAMTSRDHPTGTDRVAEVARKLREECIVNLQGDEPIVPEGLVERMVALLRESGSDVVSACHPMGSLGEMEDPNNVKVVMDGGGRAIYFSRSPVPYHAWKARDGSGRRCRAYRHIGIYAFRRDSLLRFSSAPAGRLEAGEGLEQLRVMEMGMEMRMVVSEEPTVGVDLPEHIKTVEKLLAEKYTGKYEG